MISMPEPIGVAEATKQVLHLKILVYGTSGAGKTIFGAGFPGPILMLDCDKGALSIRASKVLGTEQKALIHVVPIEDIPPGQKRPEGYDVAEAIFEELYKTKAYQGIEPKTVVVDSFTTLSQMCLSKAQYLNGHLGQQPTLPDYGGQRRHLEKIIKFGIAIPMHFVAICHEDYYKDENTGRLWLTPMIVGKLARECPLYFDEVYHATVARDSKGVESYQMECTASGLLTAKSRLGLSGSQELSFATIQSRLEDLGLASAQQASAVREEATRAPSGSSAEATSEKGGGQVANGASGIFKYQ